MADEEKPEPLSLGAIVTTGLFAAGLAWLLKSPKAPEPTPAAVVPSPVPGDDGYELVVLPSRVPQAELDALGARIERGATCRHEGEPK